MNQAASWGGLEPRRLLPNAIVTLSRYQQWVNWRYEGNEGEKPKKVPYTPESKHRASVSKLATWRSLNAAFGSCQRGVGELRFDGIGFVFSDNDPFWGIDLDNCRDSWTGQLTPAAEEIVRTMDTYTEVSPSGTGVKLFGKGAAPYVGRRSGWVEFYPEGRYFTVTMNHVEGTPGSINDRSGQLAWFIETYLPAAAQPAPIAVDGSVVVSLYQLAQDGAVLEKASNSKSKKNSEKFKRLFYKGDTTGYPSASEAEMALCGMLCYWTNANAGQMDRLFRQSALYREKWDERRGGHTYGALTVGKVIANKGQYSSGKRAPKPYTEQILDYLKLAAIRPGVPRSEIQRVLNPRPSAAELTKALMELRRLGRIECVPITPTRGRPPQAWRRIDPGTDRV